MTPSTLTSFQLGRASLAAGALFFVAYQVDSPAHGDARGHRGGQTLSGQARVVDGDTIDINGQRIRLEGIDAPETAQTCNFRSPAAPGTADTRPPKRCKPWSPTPTCPVTAAAPTNTGALLGICFTDGRDINASNGARPGLPGRLSSILNRIPARRRKRAAAQAGVWQAATEAPWDFRHKGWQLAEGDAPKGCAIKGNVSGKGHIYHMPWGPWYARVTVDARRGEHWFCTEAEAQAAGWRPALTN